MFPGATQHPQLKGVYKEGCTCCVFDPYTMVEHPKTGEVMDVFLSDVCLDAATLRIRVALAWWKIDNAETIGERDVLVERFTKLRHRYYDHVRYGRPA